LRIDFDRLGQQVARRLRVAFVERQLGQIRQHVLVEVVARILGMKLIEQGAGSLVLARDIGCLRAAEHRLAGKMAFWITVEQPLELCLGIVRAAQLNQRLAAEEQGLRGPGILGVVAQERLKLVDGHLPPALGIVPGRDGILIFGLVGAGPRSDKHRQQQHGQERARQERHGVTLGDVRRERAAIVPLSGRDRQGVSGSLLNTSTGC
jgi:hypothetical protein